ncbi:MAG: hypothetical protein E7559_04440 [Ruminococcaceae bacterium]|nr:hypothetical protein [Oscillospiraceae bacterium]
MSSSSLNTTPRTSPTSISTIIALIFLVASISIFIHYTKSSEDVTAEDFVVSSTIVSETQIPEPQNINYGEQVLFIGRSTSLTSASDCSNWSCSDSSVVSMSDTGNITALSVGDVDISCTRSNGDTLNWHIRSRKVAYLTFDDFPNENTTTILDTLDDYGIKASFFLCKNSDPAEQHYYKRMRDSGHALCNHTSHHKGSVVFKDAVELLAAFARMEIFLHEFRVDTKIIRFPHGSADPYHYGLRRYGVQRLRAMGYTIVDWTCDSNDWKTKKPEVVLRNIQNSCSDDREIILMHNHSHTAEALPSIIEWLIEQGYEFETVNDAPELYSCRYYWEPNINRTGSDEVTSDTLTELIYPDGLPEFTTHAVDVD